MNYISHRWRRLPSPNYQSQFFMTALFLILLYPVMGQVQFVQQGDKLTSIDAVRLSLQGTSVAISADGKTAVVGGPLDGFAGAAWVYTENSGVWTQQGPKLIGTGAIGLASQGNSVAVSADGNTIIVGGPDDDNLTGAAWVFTRSGGVWMQQGPKLIGTGAIGQGAQGVSVSISADGNTAIIGGSNDNNFKGAAWVFARSGGVWVQQGNKLVGTGATGQSTQGYAVGLSADGSTAIIGGSNDNSYRGAAWIFIRNINNTWTQQGTKLIGTGAIGKAIQGTSVALSADGNTAIIGGKHDNSWTGAAWIFVRIGTIWKQQGSKLVGTGVSGYSFQGYSVDLSDNGNTAILGGYGDNESVGAAWVFTRNGSAWSQQGDKLVGTGVTGYYANQGNSVSLSGDGNIAFIGGPYDNTNAGAAWVFIRNNGSWAQQGEKLVGSGASGYAYEGYSVAISADGNTALVGGYYENFGEGAVWIYARRGGGWSQQGLKLVGTGAEGVAAQGFSVDLSNDGNTAIIGGPWDNYEEGAAWIFTRKNGLWSQEGEKLVGTGALSAYQGRYVAISGDGNTAVVTGPRDNNLTGAVWVFTRNNGVWTQQGDKLTCTGAIDNPYLGRSADLSYDGNTLLVSGTFDNNSTGASWVFTRNGGVWSQEGGKLVGTGASGNAGQGVSVSLSSDGNTAMIGGTGDDIDQGAAWVFTRNGGVWTQQGGKLVGTGATAGAVSQGVSVALSGDGNTAIVGGYADDDLHGAIWVFSRNNDVWIQQGDKLIEKDAVSKSGFGYSADLSADGHTFIAGGPWENGGEGAAWAFAIPTCDEKENGCVRFELMGITEDVQKRKTYEVRVTNDCDDRMVYAAIQLPNGIAADGLANNTVYTTLTDHDYLVRNPSFSPFYSIRFNTVSEGIRDGASEIFSYTLPQQAEPLFIHAIVKLESQVYYEAHLNVFNCDVKGQMGNRPTDERENSTSSNKSAIQIYPNPTDGALYLNLSEWEGEVVRLQVFNTQGQLMQTTETVATSEPQIINLHSKIPEGIYLLHLTTKEGHVAHERIVLRR
jgi:antibiotic biosynthesis monooxygenase (ABM) superfamily enzyme